MSARTQQFVNGRFVDGEFVASVNLSNGAHAKHGCVATIGSFDGVHKGHQVLLEHVIKKAKQSNMLSQVVVFEPQPHEFFSKEKAPARLMRLREKVQALFAMGIDRVVCLRFNHALRELQPEKFIRSVLCNGLKMKSLIVGDDFKFGKERAGDFTLLCQMATECGYDVVDTQTQLATTHHDGSDRISSTRIRALLQASQFEQAAQLLGKPFCVSGRVIYGKQIGRTLGFPTANIGLGRYRSPICGVFAVVLHTDLGVFNAVANVGVRPTVGAREKPILEVHALDMKGASLELYGLCARVEFKFKIRDEKKFKGLESLKTQIADDVACAQRYFFQTKTH